jgi:hypothetical protein
MTVVLVDTDGRRIWREIERLSIRQDIFLVLGIDVKSTIVGVVPRICLPVGTTYLV